MIVIVDTREGHHAYGFPGHEIQRTALDAGDYSVLGFEASVAVERKTLDDLVKTVIQDKDRFRVELLKLKTYRAACVVVEGSIRDIEKRRYTGAAHPNSVMGAVLSIQLNYGVPVVWCGDRQIARMFTERFLDAATRGRGRIETTAGAKIQAIEVVRHG